MEARGWRLDGPGGISARVPLNRSGRLRRTKEVESVVASASEEKQEKPAPFPRTEKMRHPKPSHHAKGLPPALCLISVPSSLSNAAFSTRSVFFFRLIIAILPVASLRVFARFTH